MAIFDSIRKLLALPDVAARPAGIATPWASDSTHLHSIITAEVLSTPAAGIITRAAAIRVGALARARGLIVSTIARTPITADGNTPTPHWLTSTAGPVSPFHRMLWTADDLFFYGWSLWAVHRDTQGKVVDAARVPYAQWSFDDDGKVLIADKPVPAHEVILIPGVTEGILSHGAETISQAIDLAATAARAAKNPSAQIELHQTTTAPISRQEITELIEQWSAARAGKNGGVAYTNAAIDVREHGASSEHLLIEGRNAVAVDIARHAGIPSTMIDAVLSGSSVTYQNTSARLTELVTFGLAPIMDAIAARLSQDDVTPAGVTLHFDTTEMISRLTLPAAEHRTPKDPDDQLLYR